MFLLPLTLWLAAATVDDWPRFRGPNGTGLQETGALPVELSATKNVLWKTALTISWYAP